MKKYTLLMAAAFAGALAVTPAFAYDELITNDTAAITPAGGLHIGAGFAYLTAGEHFDTDGEARDLPDDSAYISLPLRASYGVTENLSVFAVLPIVAIDAAETNSGLGDIFLGAKYAILADNRLTLRGALDLPTGDDENGLGNDGGFGIDVAAMSACRMDRIGLNGQIGLRWNAEGPEDASAPSLTPGLGIYVDAEASYSFMEAFDAIVGLEFMSAGDGESEAGGIEADVDGMNFVELNIGAAYAIGENLHLRGDFIYTFAGKNYYKDLGFMLSAAYRVF